MNRKDNTKKQVRKPQLDKNTLEYIINLCDKKIEWAMNNSRPMQSGTWRDIKEELTKLMEEMI